MSESAEEFTWRAAVEAGLFQKRDEPRHSCFVEYADAGFLGDVIPIIPHDAKLTPNSQIDLSQRGKIPGAYSRQHGAWCGLTDWTTREFTIDDCRKWDLWWPLCNVGIKARRFPAVDLDCSHIAFRDACIDALRQRIGDGPQRLRHNSPRLLIPMRLRIGNDPMGKLALRVKLPDTEEPQLVEILGNGQQWVAAGVHPSGQAYDWEYGLDLLALGADNLPEVDVATLLDYFAHVENIIVPQLSGEIISSSRKRATWGGAGSLPIDDDSLMAPDFKADDADDIEHCAAAVALRAINNSKLPRDEWVKVTHAVKAAVAGDETFYHLVYLPWALTYPQTEENVRALWDSIDRSTIGWDVLDGEARTRNPEYRSPIGGAEFDADPIDAENLKPSEAEAEALRRRKEAEADMFGRFVYVTGIRAFVDVNTKSIWEKETVSDLYAPIWEPAGKMSAARRYLRDPRRRVVDVITYRPTQGLLLTEDGRLALNSWRASSLVPTPGDVSPWLKLVERIIPDERVRNHLLDWQAFNLQHPDIKINWHPLIVGKAGIGKDTIFVPLQKGLGADNCRIIGTGDVSADWSDYLEIKLVIVEELQSLDKRIIANKLKAYEAAPPFECRINKKFTPQYQVPNLVSFIYFSNYEDALALDDDERRHLVYQSPYIKPAEGTAEFAAEAKEFAELHAWLEREGNSHVVDWLLRRDVTSFNPGGHAPFTASKAEMILQTKSEVHRWIIEQVRDDAIEHDLVTREGMRRHLAQHAPWLQSKVTDRAIEQALRSAGAKALQQIDLNTGSTDKRARSTGRRKTRRIRPWAIRNIDMYEAMTVDALRNAWMAEHPTDEMAEDFEPIAD